MISEIFKSFKKRITSISPLKVFFLLRLFFGAYFNVSNSKPIRIILKLYCFLLCLVIIGTYFHVYFNELYKFPLFSFAEYNINVIGSLIFAEEYFFKYCSATKTNDRIIGFKKIPLIKNYMYAIVFVTFFIRIFSSVIRIPITLDNHYILFSSFCVLFSTDLNHLTIINVFSILHSRMKLLRYFLNMNSIPINITGRNEVEISIIHVRKCLYYYNNLLDNIQNIDKELQFLLFTSIVTNVPKIVYLTYAATKYYILGVNSLAILITVLEILQTQFLTSCPSAFVEATAHEVDQIKRTLTIQILRCSNEALRFELETALQYVSMRPFSYTICRAVPLNIKLPFIIISICITYFIVFMQILQFK